VGNNGETLVADSSTSTGLRYTAGTVQANPVLNSALQNWQRGTSFTITSPTYTADRWQAGRGANDTGLTVTRQTTGDTTNLPNIQYCIRSARTAGNTSTQALYLAQSFESVNSIPFAGKTVTVSFYARAGANYSGASNALILRFYTGTGTDQNVLTAGYTGSVATNTTFTLTTTWQRFSVTIAIASTATEIGYFFDQSPTGTAGANDYYEMTGMQIDIGSVALPFRTYAGTIQGELAACQRYYQKLGAFNGSGGGTQGIGTGYVASSTAAFAWIPYVVTMRTNPSSVDYGSSLQVLDFTGSSFSVSSVALADAGTNNMMLTLTITGATAARMAILRANSTTANGWVAFNAEL
jgi:hypothetical protein